MHTYIKQILYHYYPIDNKINKYFFVEYSANCCRIFYSSHYRHHKVI